MNGLGLMSANLVEMTSISLGFMMVYGNQKSSLWAESHLFFPGMTLRHTLNEAHRNHHGSVSIIQSNHQKKMPWNPYRTPSRSQQLRLTSPSPSSLIVTPSLDTRFTIHFLTVPKTLMLQCIIFSLFKWPNILSRSLENRRSYKIKYIPMLHMYAKTYEYINIIFCAYNILIIHIWGFP